MRTHVVIGSAAAALGLVMLSACGSSDSQAGGTAPASETGTSTTPSPTPSTGASTSPVDESTSPPAKRGTEIVVDDSEFGPVLFDKGGQAIYIFDVETTSKPRCYGACAEAWPPVLTKGEPVAGSGARGKLLGTTRRNDGTTQVTYAGKPLYYYAHEGKGEVKCHDVFLNGGNWYAVAPEGRRA